MYVFVGPDARPWVEAWTRPGGHSVLPTPHANVAEAVADLDRLNPDTNVDQLLPEDGAEAMAQALRGGHFPGEGGSDCRHCHHPIPVVEPILNPTHLGNTTDQEDHRMTTTPTMSFRTTGTAGGGFQTQASGFTGPAGLNTVPETARDLRAQAGQADALAEQLQLLTGVISDWRGGLADRLAGAGWGTTAITEAADAINGTGEDMTALQDVLAGLAQACQDAIAVGVEAAARAATGAAEAFQAQ